MPPCPISRRMWKSPSCHAGGSRFEGAARDRRGGRVVFGQGDIFEYGERGKDLANLVGIGGVAVDIVLERRPLSLAIALEKLLGQLHDEIGLRLAA